MGKNWWYLVFVFLMLAVVIFGAASFLDKRPVQKLQGGIIIMPGDFRGAPEDYPTTGTGEVWEDPVVVEREVGPIMPSGPTCWECPFGGVIVNVTWEYLTDQIVQDLTNCTNVSQLVWIECFFGEFNQTNVTCGDGICSENETAESCPQDCLALSPEEEERENDEEDLDQGRDEEIENILEEPEVEFYYDLTFDKRCVRLRKVTGNEWDRCDPTNPTIELSEGELSLSPMTRSFFGCLFGKMFGFPWC